MRSVKQSIYMNGKALLDTNIVIALIANEASIVDKIRLFEAVFIPSIVIGELYFGAYRSSRVDANIKRVSELAASAQVLNCDADTAQYYGRIKEDLRKAGRPIPENDIWIAAIGMQHELTMVSRDVHFNEVVGLDIESW